MFPPERSFFVQKKGRCKSTCLRLSRNPEIRENGKEDSYERNPGRVSFVFNQPFSRTLKSSGKRKQLVEKAFSTSCGRRKSACLYVSLMP